MSDGYSKTVLLNRIIEDITALEGDKPAPDEPKCSTRTPVKRGVTTLLEIQRAKIQEDLTEKNSIKIGNITVTGTMAIIVVCVLYLIVKVHGII